jgi:hypothetical protein
MKGSVGWILLGLSLVITYQGLQNSRQDPALEAAARQVACDLEDGCELHSARPAKIETEFFQHRYEWPSSLGPVHVLCRRQAIFFGTWSCEPKKGPIGSI